MIGASQDTKRGVGRIPKWARVGSVLKCIPGDGTEISSGDLQAQLRARSVPARTAIRWMEEAAKEKSVRVRSEGRFKFYSFNMTGFMGPSQAEFFIRSPWVGFLEQSRGLAPQYATSFDSMTLFWEQASSALTLGLKQVLLAAQSISFGQVYSDRAMPGELVMEDQARVLVETFIWRWVANLMVAQHLFLEKERESNWPGRKGKPKHGAPSAMEACGSGWKSIEEPAAALWRERREAGPWGSFLDAQRREVESRLKSWGEATARASGIPSDRA